MAGIGRSYPGEEEEEEEDFLVPPAGVGANYEISRTSPDPGAGAMDPALAPRGKRLQVLELNRQAAEAPLAGLRQEQEAAQKARQAEYEAALKEVQDWKNRGWYAKGSPTQPIWERFDEQGNQLPAPTPEEVQAHEQAGRDAQRRHAEAKRALELGLPELGLKQLRGEQAQQVRTQPQPQGDTRPGAWRAMTVQERAATQPLGGSAWARRHEMERELEERQREAVAQQAGDTRDAKTRQRQRELMQDFENEALGKPYEWVEYWKGKEHASSPESVAPFLLDRYLEIRDGWLPDDKAKRAQLRAELVRSMGLQPGNERGAVDRLREGIGNRRRQERLMESAAGAAMRNRVLLAAGVGAKERVADYEDWKHANDRRSPFKKDAESSYYHAWRSTGAEMEKRLQPIAGKLEEAYDAMNQGNLDLGRFFNEVDEKDRGLFLSAVRMVAEHLPAKGSTTVWEQVKKVNERYWRDFAYSMKDFVEKPFDNGPPIPPTDIYDKGSLGRWWWQHERESYKKESREYEADMLKRAEVQGRQNFRDEMNQINDQVFDPIRTLKTDGWWETMLEQAAYKAPGALASIGTAALPGGWAPLAIKGRDDTRRELRRYLLENKVDEGRANEMADNFSLALTVPMVALDRLQAAGMMRTLPFFEQAMEKTAGRIANGALRSATEMALRGGEMVASNMLLEPLPELAQEAMHALQKDVPGADWEEFFSGYWTRQASTMAVMLPLAAASGGFARIGAHLDERARVKYLMSRSDTELKALGIPLEHVKAFRAAGEDLQRAREAFRQGMEHLDPQGEAAREATRELELHVDAQQQMARNPEVQRRGNASETFLTPEQEAALVDEAYAKAVANDHTANTDDVRPLVGKYQGGNPLLRDDLFHRAASRINERVVDRLLARKPDTGAAVILAGGPGSGKSTSLDVLDLPRDLVIDTTLSTPAGARKLINKVRASGREPAIVYVDRPFADAFEGTITRYLQGKEQGEPRLVPLKVTAESHVGARETALQMAREGTKVHVMDNSRTGQPAVERDIGFLENQRYAKANGNAATLHNGREESLRAAESGGKGGRHAQGTGRNGPADGREVPAGSGGESAGGAGVPAVDGEEYTAASRVGEVASLYEEGRAIVEKYRREGKLTAAEAKAFLGWEGGDGGKGSARSGAGVDGTSPPADPPAAGAAGASGPKMPLPSGDEGADRRGAADSSTAFMPLSRDAVASRDKEVYAAAMAPDARQRLGDVRAGSLHALEAYRFFMAKLEKKGSLTEEEQVKLGRANMALAKAAGARGTV